MSSSLNDLLGTKITTVLSALAMVGKNAEAQVNGVMFTEGKQQLVYNTLQHHEAHPAAATSFIKGHCKTAAVLYGVG